MIKVGPASLLMHLGSVSLMCCLLRIAFQQGWGECSGGICHVTCSVQFL